jgi:hypothetical protein
VVITFQIVVVSAVDVVVGGAVTSAERPFLCRKIFSRRNSYIRLLVGSGQSGSSILWRSFEVREHGSTRNPPATEHFLQRPSSYHGIQPNRTTNTWIITTIHNLLTTKPRSRLLTYRWISSLNWSPGESIQRTQKVRLYYQPWSVTTQPTAAMEERSTAYMTITTI